MLNKTLCRKCLAEHDTVLDKGYKRDAEWQCGRLWCPATGLLYLTEGPEPPEGCYYLLEQMMHMEQDKSVFFLSGGTMIVPTDD